MPGLGDLLGISKCHTNVSPLIDHLLCDLDHMEQTTSLHKTLRKKPASAQFTDWITEALI